MKYVKRFFGVSALLAIGFSVWWMGMNYNGYCHAEGRYLSDEDLIKSAIRYNAVDMGIDNSEESIVNFENKNAKCCLINRFGSTSSSKLEKLFGFYYSVVEINYEIPNTNKILFEAGKNNFYQKYVRIDSCGSYFGSYGEKVKN